MANSHYSICHRMHTTNPRSLQEPVGTQNKQCRQSKHRSDKSVELMRTCSFTRAEAWTYHYACYLRSIGANLHFTEAQLTNIQNESNGNHFFATCGYKCNTKREILYGPWELGGANFWTLYDQQGIGQIQLFMVHLKK